jgi:hypothetical protein
MYCRLISNARSICQTTHVVMRFDNDNDTLSTHRTSSSPMFDIVERHMSIVVLLHWKNTYVCLIHQPTIVLSSIGITVHFFLIVVDALVISTGVN